MDNSHILSGKRLLIVEDEITLAEIIIAVVLQQQMIPEMVTNQHEAILRFHDHEQPRIDMLISDIHLDDGDGFKLAVELRRIAPNLPIVLTSGRQYSTNDFVKIQLASDIKFLKKPFKISELTSSLQSSILDR